MSDRSRTGIYVGVDTHMLVHHVAAIDQACRPVDDRAFPADAAGYNAVVAWAEALGTVRVAAVEGTNSYGAGLKRVLHAAGWRLQETTPGDKVDRRLNGKSDAADAYTAARAALSGRASAIPKRDDGTAEIVRILQVNRQMLVTQQTQTINQIKALLVTAPEPLRAQLRALNNITLTRRLVALRTQQQPDELTQTTVGVLADSAQRWLDLRERTAELKRDLDRLLQRNAPRLMAVRGVGPDVAARLLAAVGDNPERIRSEAAMAHLFGVAPIPASSGNTNRHRLDRGGNRSANCAVHRIALVRLAHDDSTRDYVQRCLARGKTRRDALRLLKRAIIRELYPALTQ